jgi:hypothetical protein
MLNGLKVTNQKRAKQVVRILCKMLGQCEDGAKTGSTHIEAIGVHLGWDVDDILMAEQDFQLISTRSEILKDMLERLLVHNKGNGGSN